MENDIILKISNISKQYRLGLVGRNTINEDLKRWWYSIRGKEDPFVKIGEINDRSVIGSSDYIWALRNINIEVKRGEVLGIIGKNGAGKSTLLKILSKITSPTTGTIKSRGRIAALLEIGTGFHPELTGKENIYLNGAILGMTKDEIKLKIDEIINFSGCDRYIETPVKRYSSGMTVRLAFAVAAFLEPDILIVDEVLAVGDAEFQKKAIGKMKDISTEHGRTVLFVSHNMAAVKSLCSKAILLNNGSIVFSGKPNEVIAYYLNANANHSSYSKKKNPQINAEILEVEILKPMDEFDLKDQIHIKCIYKIKDSKRKYSLSLALHDGEQNYVLNSPSGIDEKKYSLQQHMDGLYEAICTIPGNILNVGTFYPKMLLIEDGVRIIDIIEDKVSFKVIDKINALKFYGTWSGIVRPHLKWDIRKFE